MDRDCREAREMQVPRPLQVVVVVVLWEELLPDPRKEVDLPTGHRAADQEEKRGREGGWERVSGRLRLKRRAWGGREARGEMWETDGGCKPTRVGKKTHTSRMLFRQNQQGRHTLPLQSCNYQYHCKLYYGCAQVPNQSHPT